MHFEALRLLKNALELRCPGHRRTETLTVFDIKEAPFPFTLASSICFEIGPKSGEETLEAFAASVVKTINDSAPVFNVQLGGQGFINFEVTDKLRLLMLKSILERGAEFILTPKSVIDGSSLSREACILEGRTLNFLIEEDSKLTGKENPVWYFNRFLTDVSKVQGKAKELELDCVRGIVDELLKIRRERNIIEILDAFYQVYNRPQTRSRLLKEGSDSALGGFLKATGEVLSSFVVQ